MASFAGPLKKDLSRVRLSFLMKGKEKLNVVMGRVVDSVDSAALSIPVEKDLTAIQELEHFRRSLNEQLNWEHEFEAITDDELSELRKIVNDLTETDHLRLVFMH